MLGDALCLVLAANHKARDVLQEQQRDLALAGQLDEVRALHGAFGKEHAVVGQDRHRHAPDVGKAADQRGAVMRLELVKFAAVDQPGDHFMDVIGRADIVRDHGIKFFRIVLGRARFLQRQAMFMARAKVADDVADNGQGMLVVFGQMIDHAALAGMEIPAAKILGADFLARRSLYQGRAGQENRALFAHDHRLVRHRGDIGPARRAGTHDAGDLGDALRTHIGLVEKDPAEVVAIGEDLGLVRQVGPARVDQVDAGQVVGLGDFLRAQVLLDGQRIIGAALHRRIIGHDHAQAA